MAGNGRVKYKPLKMIVFDENTYEDRCIVGSVATRKNAHN